MYTPTHLPDTQAVTEFREKTSSVLRQIRRNDRPLLLTQNGKAAGVVLSPRAYASLADAAALANSIESVRRSLADAKSGRTRRAKDVLDDLDERVSKRKRRG